MMLKHFPVTGRELIEMGSGSINYNFCNSCGAEVISDESQSKANTSAGKYGRLHDLDKGDTLAQILFGIDVVAAISSNSLSTSLIETVAYGLATIACIYLVFFPGTHGDNKYGADPLG